MQENKNNTSMANFVAYCIIIIIGFYLVASTIVPFVPVPPQTFTIIFTIAGGVPSLFILFNQRYGDRKKFLKL